MTGKVKYFFLLLLGGLMLNISPLAAQRHEVDSLLHELKTSRQDTTRVNLLYELSWSFVYINPDSTILLAKQGAKLTDKLLPSLPVDARKRWKASKAKAYSNQGTGYYTKGDFTRALENYLLALKIDEQYQNSTGISTRLGNIGNVYVSQGNYNTALDYYFRALRMDEKLKDTVGIAFNVGNIGITYYRKGERSKAFAYCLRTLHMYQKLNNASGVAISLSILGNIFKDRADSSLAAGNRKLALSIYPDALDYYFRALKTAEEMGALNMEAAWTINIGAIYVSTGDLSKAEKYLTRGQEISYTIKAVDHVRDVEYYLSELYRNQQNFDKALDHYKKFIEARNNIANEETTKKQTQMEMQFAFQKERAADSIQSAEKSRQAKLKHNRKIKRQKTFTIAGVIACLFMLTIALLAIRGYLQKQKTNRAIEEQKKIVEEKQKEILDSIHYAKRIQQALLPSPKSIDKKLKQLNR